jgi:hypothetical protein
MWLKLLSGELVEATPETAQQVVYDRMGLNRERYEVKLFPTDAGYTLVLVDDLLYSEQLTDRVRKAFEPKEVVYPYEDSMRTYSVEWWVSGPREKDDEFYREYPKRDSLEEEYWNLSYTHFAVYKFQYIGDKSYAKAVSYHHRKENIRLENPTPEALERLEFVLEHYQNVEPTGEYPKNYYIFYDNDF